MLFRKGSDRLEALVEKTRQLIAESFSTNEIACQTKEETAIAPNYTLQTAICKERDLNTIQHITASIRALQPETGLRHIVYAADCRGENECSIWQPQLGPNNQEPRGQLSGCVQIDRTGLSFRK